MLNIIDQSAHQAYELYWDRIRRNYCIVNESSNGSHMLFTVHSRVGFIIIPPCRFREKNQVGFTEQSSSRYTGMLQDRTGLSYFSSLLNLSLVWAFLSSSSFLAVFIAR